ncbi:MAG: DUF550 domain-containing protein [Alphaproteobacteria bacterium]|nr:DUF550 domain-containing protein [Alphaproteobacteria bacterium]
MFSASHFQEPTLPQSNEKEAWDDELAFAYAAQTLAAYRVWSDQRFGTTEQRGPNHFISCMIKSLENLEHDVEAIDTYADIAFMFTEALHRSGFSLAELEKAMRDRFADYTARG